MTSVPLGSRKGSLSLNTLSPNWKGLTKIVPVRHNCMRHTFFAGVPLFFHCHPLPTEVEACRTLRLSHLPAYNLRLSCLGFCLRTARLGYAPPWQCHRGTMGLLFQERGAGSWLVGLERRAQGAIPWHKFVPKQGLSFDPFTDLQSPYYQWDHSRFQSMRIFSDDAQRGANLSHQEADTDDG